MAAVLSQTQSGGDIPDNCGSTQIITTKLRYIWIIDNFNFYCTTMGSKIESPTFSDETNKDGLNWILQINPDGWYTDDDSDESYLSLHLQLVSCTVKNVNANFKFSILNTKSKEVSKFEDNKLFEQGKYYGINSFLEKGRLLNDNGEFLPEDKLTIICEITTAAGVVLRSSNVDATDELPSNKNLPVQSSALKTITFEHSLENTKTCESSNLERLISDLLFAAEQYKSMCVNAMCSILSVENAALIFKLGDKHSIVEMKMRAKDFICDNSVDVTKTLEWKSMTKSHPHLATEVVYGLATSLTPTKSICQFKSVAKPLQEDQNELKSESPPKSILQSSKLGEEVSSFQFGNVANFVQDCQNELKSVTPTEPICPSFQSDSVSKEYYRKDDIELIFPNVKLASKSSTLLAYQYTVEFMNNSSTSSIMTGFKQTSQKRQKIMGGRRIGNERTMELPRIDTSYTSKLASASSGFFDRSFENYLELKKNRNRFELWVSAACGTDARWAPYVNAEFQPDL